MKRSTDRILTTRVGRLQRPEDLTESMSAQPRKRPTDAANAIARRVHRPIGYIHIPVIPDHGGKD